MPAFRFRAVAPDGARHAGLLSAASLSDARRRLEREGWLTLELTEAASPAIPRERAARAELAVLLRALAELVQAGVPVDRAVHAVRDMVRGPLRDLVERARAALQEGRPLAAALSVAPGVLPSSVVAALHAGERAGRLGPTLDQLATDLEIEAELRAQVRQALAYPILLVVAGTVSVLVLDAIVLPRFALLLGEAGVVLPTGTRLLLGVSEALTRWWWACLAGVAIAAIVLREFMHRAGSLATIHRLALRLPVLGPIRMQVGTARALRALGAALGAGASMLPALRAAGSAAGDMELGLRLTRAEERVRRGEQVAASLAREGALAPVAIQLAHVGEASGQLPAMCERAARLTAADAVRRLRLAVALIEPLLILVFGAVIAAIAAALLQAVYALRPT